MIETKTFELRDKGTFISAVGMMIDPSSPLMTSADVYLARRAGYGFGSRLVVLTRLDGDGSPANYDPYSWGDRTWHVAHRYITDHWDELESGALVDVEFALGESAAPKVTERVEYQV